jgi:predicted Zn finger-like uncharacterized protein
MPVIVACPSCGDRLSVPDDFLGRTVRCGSCSSTFEAREAGPEPQPAPAAGAEERFSDRPVGAEPGPGGERFREGAEPPYRGPAEDRRDDDYPPREDYPPRDYDDRDDDIRRRYIRRDVMPHRGGLVLTLGIISIVMGTIAAPFCGLSPLISIGLGVTAFIMGRGDLKKMDEGVLDPDGRGQTKGGFICGIVGMCCGILALIACGIYLVFIFTMMATQK